MPIPEGLSAVLSQLPPVPPLDVVSQDRAQRRLADLIKPLGSLGRLEQLVVQLAGIEGRPVPSVARPAALLFAGDHGVSRHHVSRYDPDVTEQMATAIAMGGAVSSVLARSQSLPLQVVDVGLFRPARHPGVVRAGIRAGTGDIRTEAAMRPAEAAAAVEAGVRAAAALVEGGADLLVLGEMGIGNTTATAALAAVLLGVPAERTVGPGTGIGPQDQASKVRVVAEAVARQAGVAQDPWAVLTHVGGLEIAALAGAMLAAAGQRVPIVLDGVTTAVAALWASQLAPALPGYCVASHRSPEPAHALLLARLGLEPLVDWQMRLGEGSGALMLLPIIRQAVAVMQETATFADARVANPHAAEPAPPPAPSPRAPVAPDFTEAERAAVYKAIHVRRDIRSFLPDPIDPAALRRILAAAHAGPSVGLMQPWNFIVVDDGPTRQALAALAEAERIRAADNYGGMRRDQYLRLKVEGLADAPCTVAITNDPARGGVVLGRNTIPETDLMSTACAIENLWLAARAEGVGVGWVSFYQKADVRAVLGIPDAIDPVALLCLGYTAHFPDQPLLERVAWAHRRPLDGAVYHNRWDQPWRAPTDAAEDGSPDA